MKSWSQLRLDSQAEKCPPKRGNSIRRPFVAFDADFLGFTPDYRVSIRADVLQEKDGPMLRYETARDRRQDGQCSEGRGPAPQS